MIRLTGVNSNLLFSLSKMYFALTESISEDRFGGLLAGVASETAFERTEFELLAFIVQSS